MIQYIQKQRNQFSCGPVAILNALKWRGDAATYDSHYRKLLKACKTDSSGTDSSDFEKTLKKYKFKFKKTRYLKDVQNHLKAGGAVILCHLDSDDDWHYSFWYEFRFKRFFGANIDYSTGVKNVTEKTMRRYLLKTGPGNEFVHSDGYDVPEALLLSL